MGLFSWFRPPSAPDEIYASSLQTLYLGHALWYPEPHETGEPQIGDVGFVDEGAFVRLFNLDISTPEKKVMFWDPPFEITEPAPPGVFRTTHRRSPLVPKDYRSHGVESKELHTSADITAGANISLTLDTSYTCKAAQGAVLVLKSEAHAEKIFENRLLKKYIVRHCDRWYAYARNDIFQDIKQEDIVVVSGWVKTTADWAAVAFSNMSTSSSASLAGHAGGVAGAAIGGSHSRSMTGPRMERQGQDYLKNMSDFPPVKAKKKKAKTPFSRPAGAKRDQCVLVKRYKIRKRLGILKKVVAGAGYDRLPGSGGGRGASRVEVAAWEDEDENTKGILEAGSEGEIADPLDVLLDYILEVADVGVAIASDDDVESIIGGNHVVDFASYLRQVQPLVDIDGTLGSLCIEDVIHHERERAFARRIVTASTSDLAKWPSLSLDGAGRLVDWRIFVGLEEANTPPLTRKFKQLVFIDPQDTHAEWHKCECYALSTDGKLLAASFSSNTVLVWRLPGGLLVHRLQSHVHSFAVTSLSFSPSGHVLVSGSEDETAILWNVQHGSVLRRLTGHRSRLNYTVYSPNGVLIATSSLDRSVKIWDASTGACQGSFRFNEDIYQLIFSPDSSRLCIQTFGSCSIYDAQSYRRIALLRQNTALEPIGFSMSRQGDRVVTGASPGNQMRIWDAVTGRQLLPINDNKRKPSYAVAFSPDGAEVLAVARKEDRCAVAYDSRTGRLRHIFGLSHTPSCIAYSPNGDYVAFAGQLGSLEVYDARSRTFIGMVEGFEEDGNILQEAKFSPDSQTILSHFSKTSREPLRLCNVQDIVRMR